MPRFPIIDPSRHLFFNPIRITDQEGHVSSDAPQTNPFERGCWCLRPLWGNDNPPDDKSLQVNFDDGCWCLRLQWNDDPSHAELFLVPGDWDNIVRPFAENELGATYNFYSASHTTHYLAINGHPDGARASITARWLPASDSTLRYLSRETLCA